MHWHPQNVLHGFEATVIDESGRVEWNAHGAKAYALPEHLHPTVWTADRAVEAIKGYSSGQPLFLKVSSARPHSPYDPPRRIVDMYEGREIPAPAVGDWCEDLATDTHPEKNPEAAIGNYGVEYARNSRKYYYASVTFIDEQVELRDLLPTFLALNNRQVPEEMDDLSLLPLLEKGKASWRKYIDIEHSTAYWADNYWCALTDGKIKYIWFFRTGEEQLFDLSTDPHELHDLSQAEAYGKTLEEMRNAMAEHLQERGEEWVKDGRPVIRKKNLLYSPNYPSNK